MKGADLRVWLEAALGRPAGELGFSGVGGGCINRAGILSEKGGERWFVKFNDAHLEDMFAAEAEGLRVLAASHTLRVPSPIAHGVVGGASFLILEYIPMGGKADPERLGLELAALHNCSAQAFGWLRDNTIGSTPQANGWLPDWLEFWRRRRLGFQLELAKVAGAGKGIIDAGYRLCDGLEAFFQDYRPRPSLLHGDLWSGNYGFATGGEPILYDPAVYYGDREADLAMTELFGGFPARFYDAYADASPLDPGYGVRKTLYNLYHVLNHFNLFGGGYGSQAKSMIDRLLAEIER